MKDTNIDCMRLNNHLTLHRQQRNEQISEDIHIQDWQSALINET